MSHQAQLPYTIPYEPGFLRGGFEVPLPTLSPESRAAALGQGQVFDFIHYSLVMHQARQNALFTASNLDGSRKVQIARKQLGARWLVDDRIGYENQVADWGYGDDTAFDRGHLVRREDVQWGDYSEARDAARSTFFYANAALQHMNFNQDEWLELEDYALGFAVKNDYRLCIFAGPVFSEDDLTYDDVPEKLKYRTAGDTLIPTSFWKVIVLRQESAGGADLAALAFTMDQTKLWKDKSGTPKGLKPFQIPLSQLETLVGLDFGALRQVDELSIRARLRDGGPVEVEITGPDSIVLPSESRRRGRILARSLRVGDPSPTLMSEPRSRRVEAECGCEAKTTDTRVSQLEQQVETLAEALKAIADVTRADSPGEAPQLVTTARAAGRGRAAIAPAGEAVEAPLPKAWQGIVDGLPATDPGRAQLERIARFNATRDDLQATSRGARLAAAINLTTRIVGGFNVKATDYPSCVSVGGPQSYFCTGVLVAPNIVLTAAHCAFDERGRLVLPSRIFLGADRIQLGSGGISVRVTRGAVHPEYLENRQTALPDGDLCVLELEKNLDFAPAGVATEEEVRAATDAMLVGFGNNTTAGNSGFGVLRGVSSPIYAPAPDDAKGVAAKLGFSPATEFVGGMRGLKKDTCRGDSGGPVYINVMTDDGMQWKVAGLTSRMTAEAQLVCGDGGIYTMIAPYLEWLKERGFAVGASPRREKPRRKTGRGKA